MVKKGELVIERGSRRCREVVKEYRMGVFGVPMWVGSEEAVRGVGRKMIVRGIDGEEVGVYEGMERDGLTGRQGVTVRCEEAGGRNRDGIVVVLGSCTIKGDAYDSGVMLHESVHVADHVMGMLGLEGMEVRAYISEEVFRCLVDYVVSMGCRVVVGVEGVEGVDYDGGEYREEFEGIEVEGI